MEARSDHESRLHSNTARDSMDGNFNFSVPRRVFDDGTDDEWELPMSDNTILGQFTKSGDWSKYSRRFHTLNREQKEKVLEAIRGGLNPENAIRKAKRRN